MNFPDWFDAPGTQISGAVLMSVGLSMPNLHPEQALLVHLQRV
jgi:alpha-galactosidase